MFDIAAKKIPHPLVFRGLLPFAGDFLAAARGDFFLT
jgi:hypothetical protein